MIDIRQQENQFASFIKYAIQLSIEDKPISFFKKYNIQQSSEEQDTELSFDMIFSGELQVSVRLRNFYYMKYNDVSIRSRSYCGLKTEINKLSEGKGHLYFYGWLNTKSTKIYKWIVYDINPIRNKLFDNGVELPNGDGTKGKYYTIKFLQENNAILMFGYNKKTKDNMYIEDKSSIIKDINEWLGISTKYYLKDGYQ